MTESRRGAYGDSRPALPCFGVRANVHACPRQPAKAARAVVAVTLVVAITNNGSDSKPLIPRPR